MAKYIDLKEAVEAVKNHSIACVKSTKMSAEETIRFNAVFASIIASLRKLPKADVVEVVRCKDCKYWDNCDCYSLGLSIADDFCSYGERITDNDL